MRAAFKIRSGGLHAPIAFEIVNDGGEMDLEFGFGKPGPLHRAKMLAAFSGDQE